MLKTRRTTPASAAAALLLAAGFPLAGPATTAHAVVVDVACKGTEQVTYTPGLTLKSQTVHYSGEDLISPCTSTDPTLTGVQPLIFTGDFVASCFTPPDSETHNRTVHWNNGKTSTVTAESSTTSVGGVLVFTVAGKVTAGEFLGDFYEKVITDAQPRMQQCLQPGGLTHQTGLITVTVHKP
ncbi:hypothetical protein ACMATS_36550 [Streptoverticillium reticulum]|uniref:hypothetical protein n=1 Tax=Streptoverticillium reticulum TaxID=1433415 RepID=UPI0039BEDC55